MLWVKRNLFLVIFGVIALGLLGWSIMFFMGKRAENAKLEEDLQAAKSQLEALYAKNPFPNETNISFATAEVARVRKDVNVVKEYFQPVPFEKVADKDFTVLLQNTIVDLQKRAQQLGIQLPEPDYAFSFKAQKNALTFAPGSFPTLPLQLAEIKALTEIIYDAKINRITNIKRMKVTTDDPEGSPDYHAYTTHTNTFTQTVSNPYQFEIHSFSGELAKLIEGLYKSKHGFILKSLEVTPAPETAGAVAAVPKPVVPQPQPQPQPRPQAGPKPKPEAMKTVLNEKLLKAVLLVEVVKPLK
ncbi:MAG TPA: Amuc_1100 family pilus-like protein [Verrucomicrobiae bacterium]|nr:Amuc_1100 family pilus-like protein [Verrucomicrobiae bacterium]